MVKFPPGMPLMLQETAVSVAPVTVALRVCAVPRSTDPLAGVTVTLMDAGVGVGGMGLGGADTTEPAIPPPQPTVHVAPARRARARRMRERGCRLAPEFAIAFFERGRIHWRNAGEVPAETVKASRSDAVRERSGKPCKLLEWRTLSQVLGQGSELTRRWSEK